MTSGQIVLLVYALLMVFGGLMGARKGSKVSMVAGSGSAAVLLIALVVSLFAHTAGMWLGAAVAAVLTITFGVRFKKTGKFMPAGMLLAISLAALIVLALAAAFGPGGAQ